TYEKVLNEAGFDPSRVAFLKLKQEEPSGAQPVNLFDGLVRNDSSEDVGGKIAEFALNTDVDLFYAHDIYSWFTGKNEEGQIIFSEEEVQRWLSDFKDYLSSIRDEDGGWKEGYNHYYLSWLEFCHDSFELDYRIYFCVKAERIIATFQGLIECLKKAGVGFKMKTIDVENDLGQGKNLLPGRRKDHIILYFSEGDAPKVVEAIRSYVSSHKDDFYDWEAYFGKRIVPDVPGARIAGDPSDEMREACCASDPTYNSVIASIISAVVIKAIKRNKGILKEKLDKKHEEEVDSIIEAYFGKGEERRKLKEKLGIDEYYEAQSRFIRICFRELSDHFGEKEFHRLLTDIYKEHLAESGLDPSRVSFLRMMPEADPGDVEKKAQIGKRAKVESVDLEKGIAVARDSKGKERRIKLIPEDRLDIELFKDVICSTDKIKEERKQIINSILSLLEKSPPAFFTYDELVDDLFGFAWHEGRDKFVALHRLVADKKIMFFDWPVAMFHELAEYLIKAGRLKIKPENRMLIVSLDGQELPPILLSAETLQFIEKERKSEDGWPDGWEKNPHYLLRALQRELFGVLDETLTLRLKRIGGINSAVGLNDYLKVKDKGFELVGVNWHREIRKDLEELIGIGYLPWRPGVYAPTNDYKMAIHYAKNVARETEKLAERLKAKGRNDMRVLVIGAGTGIDALTAFHHARMNGISGVKVDAIDIDPMAVDNTLFSSELILGPDSNCIQPILVGEGKEFEGLDASYDLILFNAPNAIEVRPGQQIDTRAHMDKEVFKQIVEQICRRLSPEGMAIVDNIDTVFDDGRIKIGAVLDVEVMDAYEGGGTDEVKRVSFRLTPRKKEMSPMGGGMKPADLQERARKEGPKWSVGYLIRTGLFSQAKLIREVLSAAQKKEFSRVLLARAEAVYRAVASNRRNRIHARRSLALAYADLFWQLITGRARSKSGHEDETFSERKKALDRKWRSVERLFRQRKEQARRAGWFNAGFVRNAIIEEELEDWSDIARFIISLIPKGKKHNSLRNALEKAVSSVNEKGIAVDPRKELRKLKKEFKLSKDHAEILGLALGLGWGQGGGSSQEANRLHEICAHIRCAYEHRDKKDPRQLNRQILSMKDKYKEIKDLFLTEEGWYLHLEVKGQASFCKISMEGVFEPIEQELFLSRQLQVPDNSRYEVFDGTIEISGDPPVWSWKVYRELQEAGEQERIRNEIVDRILELRGSLKKMLEANASEDEMRPVVDELESLTDSLRPVRPRAAGREEKSIEKYSEFFLKVKEVAFKKIDDYTANAGLAGKLREVKNRWEDYEICVERPTWYRLATTLLGFFRSKVFIHIDLWEEILRQKDAAEILAEITARAILKDIEGRETDDNFELGRIFTNGRLKELEERVREGIRPGTAKIKEEMPANELRRIFNGLNVEERQVLAFMARRDPSALFAPLPDFSWRESELFFDRFNDVILVDGKYQYKGPEGVFKEVESEIRMRMANGSKRERYIKALGEIRKRLVFLAEYAETNFFKLGYLGFHEHDWELLAKLDIKLRNKILGDIRFHRDLRVNDSRVGQNIMFNLLSKLRQAGAVENFDDLYDLADDSRSEPIDLKIAIRSPHRIGFELPLHTGELSAVDFFDIAKKFNIHLQYMDAYNNGYSREMS
ncbi:MAG: hypothetical protein PVH45_03165, partial [Candidatus Omnitrophota bacterium]